MTMVVPLINDLLLRAAKGRFRTKTHAMIDPNVDR
jgi:hypothetical protein